MPKIQENVTTANTIESLQGSLVSPIIANIYLPYVIDDWFRSIGQSRFEGRAEMVKYVDDMIFTFESMHKARRFYSVLPKRLAKFGLEMHREKSSIIPAGYAASLRAHKEKRRLPTFLFFRIHLLLSKVSAWFLDAEIYQSSRPLHDDAQGHKEVSQE